MLGKIILQNLEKYDFPYNIDKKICSGWASDLPKGGETILFTSCMHQTASLSDTFSRTIPLAEKVPSLSVFAKLIKPNKEQLERSYKVLRNIVSLLKKNGVNFGYLYEEEPYSGAILLELGYLNEFGIHAERVTKFLKEKGVKRIITVDPHTHNALNRYSEFTKFDIEVVNYLELIKDAKIKTDVSFVIHDSCLYSRFLGLRDVYRQILTNAGGKIVEDLMVTSKEVSYCCGSPIKPVNHELGEKVAKSRVEQLKKLSDNILVVCPMCYANLSKYHNKIYDLAEVVE
ncbi:(Fe-S)-binding protein [Sulfolobus acidocaldarius]|uniref:Conserved Archaeal protein n=4 Tax=Sulfolobus acidocaldarius TaxID=2285 RepID=Q4J8A5_SULAC|nr:(Fe-S)-binding protein [Sulfolobus acidocaldarius]AAY80976.1 conserved Archaeal protein [Sulfolobus acidocaldarius DSM 639]AGE71577.1 hypothetical protein SacN8_08085 [Sulfolobus acidocaldarius N8]AGE73850.1 hypothetical protein SacRon12I_08095 [Sulfolobus acidocaldarius Ron12/I]ALU30198.1 Fe-S oxidoreductase [Sulfolobus acidocaldarius]ALU30913.1 Fe-S oxidoreductase [Sulfolobus acidocaldarius]